MQSMPSRFNLMPVTCTLRMRIDQLAPLKRVHGSTELIRVGMLQE